MNKKNLILTATKSMNRQQWLEFRQPLTHVRNFLDSKLRLKGVDHDVFWLHGDNRTPDLVESLYNVLIETFKQDDWQNFQFPTIGGSEISSIMGLNPYKSSIELYFEKVGLKKTFDGDNVAMFWGRELEEQIAEKWQYWDGSAEGMIDNFAKGNIKRKCRRINFYVQNRNTPWIFVSLDRVINKTKTDQEVLDEGCLECKTISGWSSDMWEGGIPVMYVAQLQTQLLTCEFLFGEMAILKDGRFFDVIPFDKHPDICDRIIKDSEHFFQIVKKGIEEYFLWTYAPTDELKQQHYHNIEQLAPEPDGSDAYKNYLSQAYQNATAEGIIGGVLELDLAKKYKFYGAKINDFETLQQECSNKLKAFMKESSKIDLGKDGSVTWNNNAKGTRVFRVNVKLDPDYLPEAFKPEPGDSVQEPGNPPESKEMAFQNDPGSKRKKVVEDSDRGE